MKYKKLNTKFHEYFSAIKSGAPTDIVIKKKEDVSLIFAEMLGKNRLQTEKKVKKILLETFSVGSEDILDIIIQNLFYSQNESRPTLFESIISTAKLKDILSLLLPKLKEISEGIILGGSLVYAPFFCVRGKKYDSVVLNGKQEENPSDIDLFILLKKFDDLKKLENLIGQKISEDDRWHIDNFVKKYKIESLDYFQFKIKIDGIDVSLEFSVQETIDKLIKTEGKFVSVYSGTYSVDLIKQSDLFVNFDLEGVATKDNLILKNKTDAIRNGSIIYLPLGEIKQSKYIPDAILRAYFLPQIDIVYDKSGVLLKLRQRVDDIIKGHLPFKEKFRLLRWERMPSYYKNQIIKKLYE